MAAMFVSNKDETIPLFRNPILEYFSHIHPITPVIVFTPCAIASLWMGFFEVSLIALLSVFVAGAVFWTLVEYIIHRWVFHIHPTTETGKKIHFLVHGIHHDYPRDSTRLVMPLLVSVPLGTFFFFVFQAIMAPHNWAFFAGFLVGYIAYDSIHYATHHWNMKSKTWNFIKQYHMKHHFVDEHTAYGVSNPMWDYVFNTVPEWARKRNRKPQPPVSES